ncbi:hypothetical protein [Rubrivirga sp.]|uniref:hypothetical protein n=1 Tax=Rubrivirga sp. TaxID=1885344 RepID=UPI003C732878
MSLPVAPEERALPVTAEYHRKKWKAMALPGLVVVAFGACAVGRATVKWSDGRPYFWHGTFALVCLNAGLSVFGDAVKNRALYEVKAGL